MIKMIPYLAVARNRKSTFGDLSKNCNLRFRKEPEAEPEPPKKYVPKANPQRDKMREKYGIKAKNDEDKVRDCIGDRGEFVMDQCRDCIGDCSVKCIGDREDCIGDSIAIVVIADCGDCIGDFAGQG